MVPRSHFPAAAPSPSPSSSIGGVSPAWLEPRLGSRDLRVIDVRGDAPVNEGSGPRLRAASNVELRPFAHLGGATGWKASKERHAPRRGPSAAYLGGHVPGAVALDVRAVLFDDRGEVISAPELALVMSGIGVGDGHTVVFVDEGRPEAALAAAWALARYGHRDVHVLEGGFTRWVGEGRAVSKDPVRLAPASFTAKVFS
jgi:thiosulfate/3-mercaptopyruvate sulfurtransferase